MYEYVFFFFLTHGLGMVKIWSRSFILDQIKTYSYYFDQRFIFQVFTTHKYKYKGSKILLVNI